MAILTATTSGDATSPSWRAIAMPTEHGGWGLTAEPILLGLLVAFSAGGIAIGVAAFAAFLIRTPLKLVVIDHRRHRRLDRDDVARRIVGVEAVVLLAAVVSAFVLAGWEWLVPLALAAPIVCVELWFDVRSRGRRLVPELAGSVSVSAAAAAIVLAGGGSGAVAAAVWLILAGRVIASIPFVRTQIQRLRSGDVHTADLFQVTGVAAAVTAVAVERSAALGVASVVALAAAQAWWMRRSPVPAAKVIGLRQMVFGFAVVLAASAGLSLFA